MKTFGKFLQEKVEYPELGHSEREAMFPQPHGPVYQNLHTKILYLVDPSVKPVIDGGERWVRAFPVRREGDTLVKLSREEMHKRKLEPGLSSWEPFDEMEPVNVSYKYVIQGY